MKTKQYLDRLYSIGMSLDTIEFVDIFGKDAEYLWGKFTSGCDRELLKFYNYLDNENQEKLAEYIDSKTSTLI